jgi:hypothetical protein
MSPSIQQTHLQQEQKKSVCRFHTATTHHHHRHEFQFLPKLAYLFGVLLWEEEEECGRSRRKRQEVMDGVTEDQAGIVWVGVPRFRV